MNIFEHAEYGRLNEVQALLDEGVDANQCNKHGDTSLQLASSFGHFQVVKTLLQAGASVQSQNKRGDTALHLASFFGHYDIVTILIQKGADVDCKDKYGRTPLHLACMAKAQHVCTVHIPRALIENNANMRLRNQWGETAEYVAIQHSNDRSIDSCFREGARAIVKFLRQEREFPLRLRRIAYRWLFRTPAPQIEMRKGKKATGFKAKIPLKPTKKYVKMQVCISTK